MENSATCTRAGPNYIMGLPLFQEQGPRRVEVGLRSSDSAKNAIPRVTATVEISATWGLIRAKEKDA